MDDTHGFERMRLVLAQPCFDGSRISAGSPVARNELRLDAEPNGHVLPEHREMPGLNHQDPVARRKRVRECSLPGARSRSRIDDHRPRALEDRLDAVEHASGQTRKFWPAVI